MTDFTPLDDTVMVTCAMQTWRTIAQRIQPTMPEEAGIIRTHMSLTDGDRMLLPMRKADYARVRLLCPDLNLSAPFYRKRREHEEPRTRDQ